jgi:hypothetical protein
MRGSNDNQNPFDRYTFEFCNSNVPPYPAQSENADYLRANLPSLLQGTADPEIRKDFLLAYWAAIQVGMDFRLRRSKIPAICKFHVAETPHAKIHPYDCATLWITLT